MKKLIKVLLRESLLDEEMLSLEHLPQEVALFVNPGNYTQIILIDPSSNVVYGMLDAEDYGKYYGVGGVAAEKGFGPYIYELMMMLLNIKGKGLMPNREGDIRKTALNVWSKFYSRDDVKKETIEPINSDKTINKNYSVSILNKIDLTFNNEEEFIDYYSSLNEEDKKILSLFNTIYTMQPNAQFSTLINRGLKYENAGYLLKDAVKLANNYFSRKYRNV